MPSVRGRCASHRACAHSLMPATSLLIGAVDRAVAVHAIAFVCILSIGCGGETNSTPSGPPSGPPTIASIAITPAAVPDLVLGETVQLAAAVTLSNGTPSPSTALSWAVADPSIATVSSSGLVSSLKMGATSVIATSGSVSSPTAPIVVGSGHPATIGIVTQPTAIVAGGGFDRSIAVALRDAQGNTVVRSPANVTVALNGGGRLGGVTVVALANGIATFNTLSVNDAQGTRTLTFSAPGLQSVASNSFAVSTASSSAEPTFTLGTEENVLTNNQYGLVQTPDGPVSFFRDAQQDVHLVFSCSVSTCHLRGRTLETLTPLVMSAGVASTTLGPSRSGFDANYGGVYGVFPSTSTDLLAVYHGEEHVCGSYIPFIMGVGLARSGDGGATWTRAGQVIRGAAARPITGNCSFDIAGAGNPTIVKSPDSQYWYLYFAERVTNQADAVYLTRSPVTSNGAPGSWMKWNNGAFSQPGLGGVGTAVITRGAPAASTIFAGLPAVSWNAYLGRYLALVQSVTGFYYATSADGITWSATLPLLLTPSANDASLATGAPWVAYPSFISADQPSQMVTGRTGYLYYARGFMGGNPPHHMVRRSVTVAVP